MHFQIISKSQAKSLGIKFYFTGKPCKHGHYSERMVSKSTCRMCNILFAKKYHAENKDKMKSAAEKYRKENKDKIAKYREENKERLSILGKRYYRENIDKERERSRRWHKENYHKFRESRLAYGKKWREINAEHKRAVDRKYISENKEKIRKRHLEYYEKNKEKVSARCKAYRSRNMHKHNADSAERRAIKKRAIPKWYNKKKVDKIYKKAREMNLTVDHVIPLKSDLVCGLHCWHNLQLLSQSDNSSKGNYHWPDMP